MSSESSSSSSSSDIGIQLKKFVALNSKPTIETFPELPNIIIWVRCLLGLIYGTWLGFAESQPQKRSSGAGLMFGLNFITFLPVLYCGTFLGADTESYGPKIFFAGIFNGLALLLIVWIYFYSLEHEGEELQIQNIFLTLVSSSSSGGGGVEGGDDSMMENNIPIREEASPVIDSEF